VEETTVGVEDAEGAGALAEGADTPLPSGDFGWQALSKRETTLSRQAVRVDHTESRALKLAMGKKRKLL
jgi:hypothetical protein